jgi:Spy/CpxP family protein refolding chaperone
MKAYFVFFFAVAGCVWAQQPGEDPLREYLFPPEVVMQNQQTIGLTEDQKNFFKTELRQAQLRFTELQWKLQDEMEKMVSFLKQPKVDEQQVLTQLDKVLAAEREIKRTQIQLLVRLRNDLKPEQQSKLRELQSKGGGK